ncbi:MAG TPA: SCO1664 family protein [Chloroflexota bacterium]|nr:SCO1664 family protein [Chloroflexota bacterium]
MHGEILAHEVVPDGSNYTFFVLISADGHGRFLAVYKPQRGERPLWDFPRGTLHQREHAAYVVSRHLGWPNIPVTVIRDGPFGIGSVQLYVPIQDGADYFSFRHKRRRDLMQIALFDLLVNNADRKGGHCLLGEDGRLWAIDHGLTFHVEPKLRTILWDYCGQPVPQRLLEQMQALREDEGRSQKLREALEPDLEPAEIKAFFRRIDRILKVRHYPQLDPNRNVPWPPI